MNANVDRVRERVRERVYDRVYARVQIRSIAPLIKETFNEINR